jgi:hypothetical protein
MYFSLFLNVET